MALFSLQFVPAGCDFNSLPTSTIHFDGIHENKTEAKWQLFFPAER